MPKKKLITIYGHVGDFVVNENDSVKRGDVIGFSGNTGTCGRSARSPPAARSPHARRATQGTWP